MPLAVPLLLVTVVMRELAAFLGLVAQFTHTHSLAATMDQALVARPSTSPTTLLPPLRPLPLLRTVEPHLTSPATPLPPPITATLTPTFPLLIMAMIRPRAFLLPRTISPSTRASPRSSLLLPQPSPTIPTITLPSRPPSAMSLAMVAMPTVALVARLLEPTTMMALPPLLRTMAPAMTLALALSSTLRL